MKLLPHLVSVYVWRFHHLRGWCLIPFSYHTLPHTTWLCVEQNPGLRPMQMAIIWWLTALVSIMLGGNCVFLSFTEDWMNYPVVSLSLSSSSSSSSPSSFGLSLATHVRKKLWGRETRWPQVQEDWRHSDDFVSYDLTWADESESVQLNFKWVWKCIGRTRLGPLGYWYLLSPTMILKLYAQYL